MLYPVIRDRKIRAAVVGCGRISANHFRAIAQHADAMELVAVCDDDLERMEDHAREHQVRPFGNYERMLRDCNCDLVVLCTPSGLHARQTIAASRYKKHVMCEKPMATRWKDGLAMVEACDAATVRLFIVKQNRRNATLQMLRRAVDEKRFGRIHMVQVNVFWARQQEYYDSAKWRGTWEMDGGAFMNQASHYIDLLEWLIGPVADVQAMTGTLARDIEVEDSGVLNVRWRNGALGSVAVTMLTWPKNLEGSITIIGEKGTARIGGVAVNEMHIWDFAEKKDYDDALDAASYETTSVYGYGHPLYYKNVIDTLRGETEPETDGREGLKSLEVLIAAYISARDRKTVSLPLEY